MRFVCDNCRAQYMISDDKVGPKGVKVRCKKCSYVILVQKTQEPNPEAEAFDPEATQIMENPFTAEGSTRPGMAGAAVQGSSGKSGSFLASVPDDEIGAVFDKVLSSGAHSMKDDIGAGQGPEDDGQSTRVLDPETVKRLAEKSELPAESNGEAEGEAAAEAGKYDWFVAIDEKQTGPLTLDAIKRRWNHGEIGPDSLCWRAGFADWVPLSDVVELKSVLAPKRAKPVIVAPTPIASPAMAAAPVGSAFAAGTGGNGSAAAADMSGADGEWKPVAASALASLAKQEMDVLSKPGRPPASNSPRVTPARGLLELPTASETPSSNGHAPPPNGAVHAQQVPTFAPYGAHPPPATKYGRYVAVGAGLALLVVGLAVGSYLIGENKGAGTQRPPPPPAAQSSGAIAKPDLPMPPPPQPKTVADGKPGPSANVPTEAAPAKDSTGARDSRTDPVPDRDSWRAERSSREPGAMPSRRRERSNRSKTGETETGSGGQSGEVILPASPGEKAADDAFEREFGAPKKEVARKEEPRKSGKGPSIYVPPAPGSGAELPEELGQSDILQVVLANKPKLSNCRDEQKKKDPSVSGTLVVRWTIMPSGRTSNISVASEEFKTTYFANCVAGALKGWTFPSHRKQGGQVVEGFPFIF